MKIDLSKVERVMNFRSSTIGDNVIYSTLLFKDGTTSCNCPGWVFKRKSKDRDCKHCRMIRGEIPVEANLVADSKATGVSVSEVELENMIVGVGAGKRVMKI
jgi:hypothetical protein